MELVATHYIYMNYLRIQRVVSREVQLTFSSAASLEKSLTESVNELCLAVHPHVVPAKLWIKTGNLLLPAKLSNFSSVQIKDFQQLVVSSILWLLRVALKDRLPLCKEIPLHRHLESQRQRQVNLTI